jgi:hypothetical protein
MTALFPGSVLLMRFGMLGEYLGRVFDETNGRSLCIVERVEPGITLTCEPRPN